MSSIFTPTDDFKQTPEKEWAAKLGGLDWDKTHIVFTKRSLVDFLKYSGVSLDPNFHSISKLPRYAQVGNMDVQTTDGSVAEPDTSPTGNPAPAIVDNNDYRPSRRVREAPGGRQTFSFGDGSDELFDAPATSAKNLESVRDETDRTQPEEDTTNQPVAGYRPSRRVRTAPGGPSSIAQLWNDEPSEEPQYRPTRRVRERPGGVDSVADIL